MIEAEDKAKWLLELHKGDLNKAIEHAQDCLYFCKIDNEPEETKNLFIEVLKILKK